MYNCNPLRSPLPVSHIPYEPPMPLAENDAVEMATVPYREVLGSLLYPSTRTRPDLATVVSMLDKYASCDCPIHRKAMKRVQRYLKGTKDMFLCFKRHCRNQIKSWSDADWGRDQDKRRSRSGMLTTIGGNPVSWMSRL